MSLTATAHAVPGTLRQEVLVGRVHELVTDQPIAVGGEGRGPSPHELFPAALASCVAVTLTVYARTKHWELGDVRVDVDYDHRSTPRRCRIVTTVTGELTPAQIERLEKVAAACPLRRAIDAGFVFDDHLATCADGGEAGSDARARMLQPS